LSKLTNIKSKITQLSGGAFQELCDAYLSKKGYQNPMSLGTHFKSQSTTKGTPDTYFLDSNGRYIFVEYTNQQKNLLKKIKEDIVKCLDVGSTKIALDKILKIIYCHTSSNLTPAQIEEIKQYIPDSIDFEMYGIDVIALDLLDNYPILARDFLDIPLDNSQILDLETFKKQYNARVSSAKLSTTLVGRDVEMGTLSDILNQRKVCILTGDSGCGKTKLAVDFAKSQAENTNIEVICLVDNGEQLYSDLKANIECNKSYLIIIDDANQLSQLSSVIQLAVNPDVDVKFILTVRNYANEFVKQKIKDITNSECIELNKSSNEQIERVCKEDFEIINQNYIRQIQEIAKGNMRIAVLAAQIANDKNNFKSISDASDVYDYVYSGIKLGDNAKNELVLGIMVFIKKVNLLEIKYLEPILTELKLTQDDFVDSIKELHKLEFVDLCNDQAAKISDQCLGDYLVKKLYVDDNKINLKNMIKVVFENNTKQAVETVSGLFKLFPKSKDAPIKAANSLWDEYESDNSNFLHEFVISFGNTNPNKKLLYIKQMIESSESNNTDISDLNIENNKNNHRTNDDILKMLGDFLDTDYFETALDLALQYYKKRPDLYLQFYFLFVDGFNIKPRSHKLGYQSQIKMFTNFPNCSSENEIKLFLEVVNNFLKLSQNSSESMGKTIQMYQYSVVYSKGSKKYRQLIWEKLIELANSGKYNAQIKNVVSNYYVGSTNTDPSDIISFDYDFMIKLVPKIFEQNNLNDSILLEDLKKQISYFIKDNDFFKDIDPFFNNKKYKLYSLLQSTDPYWGNNVQSDKKKLDKYIQTLTNEQTFEIIDIYNELTFYKTTRNYRMIKHSIVYILDNLSDNDYFVDSVEYIIKNCKNSSSIARTLISGLMNIMKSGEVWDLINRFKYEDKNCWLYNFFCILPENELDEDWLKRLYSFLEETPDGICHCCRNILEFEKFNLVDKNALVKCCTKILEYDDSCFIQYFFDFFNKDLTEPPILISKVIDNIPLLKSIYLRCLKVHDYSDYDGEFLLELIKADPNFLADNLGSIADNLGYGEYSCFKVIFQLDNYCEVLDLFLEKSIEYLGSAYKVNYIFEDLMVESEKNIDMTDKRNLWISEAIKKWSNNNDYMSNLFDVIANFDDQTKLRFLGEFVHLNKNIEDFKVLLLPSSSMSLSGSQVPIIDNQLTLLNKLKKILPQNADFLEHRAYIDVYEDNQKEYKKNVEIHEMMREWGG
jgi:hypothetical protein